MSIVSETTKIQKRVRDDIAVFDRRYQTHSRAGVAAGGHYDVSFHRTAKDRTPAKRVVTGLILGDPAPGRSAQDKLDLAKR